MNIVFDFGAVLFGWQPAHIVRQHLPQHVTGDASAQALGKAIFSHADWQAFDQGLISEQAVVQRTSSRLALPSSQVASMVALIGEQLPVIPTSLAVLQQLRDRRDAGEGEGMGESESESIRLYYLSNMPEPYARTLERNHAFLQWFDDGIFSGDIKLIKPDPAIYAAATQRFNLQGQTTIFIDDSLPNVQAAQAHGWRAVHLPSPEQLPSKLSEEIGR